MGAQMLQGDGARREVSGHHELGFVLSGASQFVPSGTQDEDFYERHGALAEWEALVSAVNALLGRLWEAKAAQEYAKAVSELRMRTERLSAAREIAAAAVARAAEGESL